MILEEHALLHTLHELDIPVIPPLIFHGASLFDLLGIPFAVFPKKGGRLIDELNQDQWEEVGRLIGRIHHHNKTLDHSSRITWRPSIATQQHVDTLQARQVLPADYIDIFDHTTSAFISKTDPLFNEDSFLLLHGDCHLGNIIFRPGEHHYILDFDDMSFGPPIQDVWMLLPDSPEKCPNEMEWFLSGYETFCDVDHLNLSLIPPLRAMRLIHFASWCAIQKDDPLFIHHFPEWGRPQYWNELLKDIQQITYGIGLDDS